jgi:hypothetical protein
MIRREALVLNPSQTRTTAPILRRFFMQMTAGVTKFAFLPTSRAALRLRESPMVKNSCDAHRSSSTKPLKFPDGKLSDMQGGFLVRHSRLTAMGIMLCLLAALFAVEAKIAWFSPAGSASAQISFAKARPAEPPKMLPLRFTSPALAPHDFAGISILLAAIVVLAAGLTTFVRRVPDRAPVSSVFGFSPSLFFRPPPAL